MSSSKRDCCATRPHIRTPVPKQCVAKDSLVAFRGAIKLRCPLICASSVKYSPSLLCTRPGKVLLNSALTVQGCVWLAIPCSWALIWAKQLSMAAIAQDIWLCVCVRYCLGCPAFVTWRSPAELGNSRKSEGRMVTISLQILVWLGDFRLNSWRYFYS